MRLRHLALPAAAGLTLLAIPFAPAALAVETTCDPTVNACEAVFTANGSAQTFTVPAGVTTLFAAIGGASGGNGLQLGRETSIPGGFGGAFAALVSVTPGETLTLVVGGRGTDAAVGEGTTPAAGGYGGGGNGTDGGSPGGTSAGGGGGSFLFDASGKLLLAAGGGGGGGIDLAGTTTVTGGNGGASANGAPGATASGGGGATTSAGGAAGGGDVAGAAGTGPATSPTAFGNGASTTTACPGSGGGGGYFGGGSGGCSGTLLPDLSAKSLAAIPAAAPDLFTGGGGGGAGFVGAGASQVTEVGDLINQREDGNGAIGIEYTAAATTTTLTTSATTLAPGQEATLTAKVAGPALTVAGEQANATAAAVTAKAFGTSVKPFAVPTQPAPAGTTVTPATACGPGTTCSVTFFVNGTQLGDPITVDPATSASTVVFTAGSELGLRSITARYDGNLYYLQSTSNTAAITVAGLANTGAHDIAPLIGTAAGLLLVGAGMLTFGRRRPATGAHHAA